MLLCCRTGEDDAVLARALALLPESRREKTLRLPAEKQASSAAAWLLAAYGCHALGIAPEFSPDAEGKPQFHSGGRHLSLSHSGMYAACAIARGPVGVDVQRVAPVREKTAARVCTAAEQEFLRREGSSPLQFCRLWALKESYFKACGRTGEQSLAVMQNAQFSLSFAQPGPPRVQGPPGFRFFLWNLPGEYVLALCASEGAKSD
jgi:4'-phosphopantetheinyl transferase